jgi:hypothetical protein
MDMMQILEMLKQQSQQNSPLMPQASPYGMAPQSDSWLSTFPTPPQKSSLPPRNRSDLDLVQPPAPPPPPEPKPEMMGPPELTGPPRHLLGDGVTNFVGEENQLPGPPVSSEVLREDEVPDLDRKSHAPDKPFYKDNDRMAMMMAALSDGFGGMTLRGKTGMGALNKLTMANAQKNIKDNKTYDHFLQNDPEMAKVMAKIPPEYRGQFMELYQKSMFSDVLDDNTTADIRNWKFRESLDPAGQRMWDNQKTGEKMITMPDNSVIAVSRDGSTRVVLSSDEALAMTAAGADAEKGGVASGEDFRQIWKSARYTQDNLDGLYRTRERLLSSPDEGGLFQPVKLFMNRLKSEFGDIDGAAQATNEQLLQMEGIERTMQWFLNSGLGARGLDTPAEFIQWLKLNGGDLTMERDASIAFIDRALDNTMRSADRYNAARTDPLYSDVDKIHAYQPIEYTDPRAVAGQTQTETQQGGGPAEGTSKVDGGITYVFRNGRWETL